MTVLRKFKKFPLIHIHPQRMWGNPTIGNTRLTIFKVWAMVKDDEMERLLDEYPLTLGEINSALEFVEWCKAFGLIEDASGKLHYDKDALYAASHSGIPPKGRLCFYCGGFISKDSPTWTDVMERSEPGGTPKTGVCHGVCLTAIMCSEPPPRANVHPVK